MQYGSPFSVWNVFFPLSAATWLEAHRHTFHLEHGYSSVTDKATCSYLNVRFRTRDEARETWAAYLRSREAVSHD